MSGFISVFSNKKYNNIFSSHANDKIKDAFSSSADMKRVVAIFNEAGIYYFSQLNNFAR